MHKKQQHCNVYTVLESLIRDPGIFTEAKASKKKVIKAAHRSREPEQGLFIESQSWCQ